MAERPATWREAVDDFPSPVLCIVMLGEEGKERVWLSDRVESKEQYDWIVRRLLETATTAESMVGNAGRA